MSKYNVQVSWTVTTAGEVEADSEQDAALYTLSSTRRPDDGSFVPFSMSVDSIEEVRARARLFRVK